MPINTIRLNEDKFIKHLSKSQEEWTLCLGAGICIGILPNWKELTRRIVEKCFPGNTLSKEEFDDAVNELSFPFEGWLQGAFNNHCKNGGSIDSYNDILEEELYRELLIEAESENLQLPMRKMFETPKKLKKEEVFGICDFFEKRYPKTTLMQLVRVLLLEETSYRMPNSIITFNGDSLLHSLLLVFSIKDNFHKTGIYSFPVERYRKITQLFHKTGKGIPIYHIHGSISPKNSSAKNNNIGSRENLVFLEDSFTKMSSSVFSWSQTIFLNYSIHNKLVFVGMSMSDPNVRKWLSWTAAQNQIEISKIKGKHTITLRHLWIKTPSKTMKTQSFLDVSIHHLGVKIALIESWNEIETCLERIMRNPN